MASDDDGEFLFVGEKNGTVKIWNMAGSANEQDTLKQTIDIGTELFGLSFESKYFSVISLATGKGLAIRDIRGNRDIFTYTPKKSVTFFPYNLPSLHLKKTSTKLLRPNLT